MSRPLSARLALIARRSQAGRILQRAVPSRGRKFGSGSVQKLKDKVQNQKHQLAAMHAAVKSAADDVSGEAMESDSDSDGDQRKHTALTRQGMVPRKAGRKGGAGKS